MEQLTQTGTASVHHYPAGFIGAVTAAFPDDEELCRHLRANSNYVGRLLEQYSGKRITAEDVIDAFENGTQDQLLQRSRESVEAKKLYNTWASITRDWEGP